MLFIPELPNVRASFGSRRWPYFGAASHGFLLRGSVWGVQTAVRFFFFWVDWCAQQAQLQGHELLWLNMDETCVQRVMPIASGAVVGPTVLHIGYLLGLAATWGHCP